MNRGLALTMAKRALIFGITGQDGSYLAELLLEKGYEVHGVIRRSSSFNTQRIAHLYADPHVPGARLHLHYGDLLDSAFLTSILFDVVPDEVYNLAAQSHVQVSFGLPTYTADVVALGTLRLLEACRVYTKSGAGLRLYNAASSEMFGAAPAPQSEVTPFYPRSPYAVSKVASFWYTVNYREAYGIKAWNGILFNHESPRRGETFVTRKISRAVGRIVSGVQTTLYLGNLDAKRDWGHARDYVDAMWRMLQTETPTDYVIATGISHSVRDFVQEAFGVVGLLWTDHVESDPRYFRPTEVTHLQGDAAKAREQLGWSPAVTFGGLVEEMVTADVALANREGIGLGQAPGGTR